MKPLSQILLLMALVLPNSLIAQISLEYSYGVCEEFPVHITTLENSGDKYVVYDDVSYTLNLYNLNHTLFKTISIDTLAIGVFPSYYPQGEGVFVSYVKENLFDLDGQVEFVWQFSGFDPALLQLKVISAIIDESGQPLAVFDSCYIISDFSEFYQPIRNTTAGTKLFVENSVTSEYRVYSLPGTLTCNPCGSVSGLQDPTEQTEKLSSKVFPNPTNNTITIEYQLPKGTDSGVVKIYSNTAKEIRSYSIGKAFNTIQLSIGTFASGQYIYRVEAHDGSLISSGKFIVN